MSKAGELRKLAERCERTAGHRELDAEIAEALLIVDNCFTASIDAAMTLRPAGWSYQLRTAEHHENGFQFECWVSWGPIAYRRISAQAPTEALAISAGWLRAKASMRVHHTTEQSSTPIGHQK